MCNRCRQAWLPTNHRNSHGFASFGDRFHLERIFAIRSPLAELRRKSRMGNERIQHRYGPSLRKEREFIERWRK